MRKIWESQRAVVDVVLQIAADSTDTPEESTVVEWIESAIAKMGVGSVGELTVRLVDEDESAELNGRYRQKDYPTNVLSFPFEVPPDMPAEIEFPLGDIVVCAPVVERESREQKKELKAHWAHMIVHGVLHLLGMDHVEDGGAREMESKEVEILAGLGFRDPYA